MSFENSSPTVKSEEGLSSAEETVENNYDIPSDKCTCIENITCNYCCVQKYQKAWTEMRNPSNDESTLCCGDLTQKFEISEYQGEEKCVTQKFEISEYQGEEKCVTQKFEISECQGEEKCVTQKFEISEYQGEEKCVTQKFEISEYQGEEKCVTQKFEISECQGEEKCVTDSLWNSELNFHQEVDQVNSESNSHLPDKSKDETICDNLEQSNKSCDSQTNNCICSTKEESIERTDTEASTDSFSHSCRRARRCIKRKRDQEDYCPVCGLTVRVSELESHFAKEVENLSKIPKNVRKLPLREKGINNTFVQVKCNRENRLSAKVAKYAKKTVNEISCPVCSLKLTGSEDEINEHVLNCSTEDYDSDINVTDRDDNFEEYEFGNETRIRAISFVPGGYRALHGYSSKPKTAHDNDEDLNVDVDDTITYGKPQYTELDLIHNLTDSTELKQLEELKKAVLMDSTLEPKVLESRKWSDTSEKRNEESGESSSLENTDECKMSNESECTENKDDPGNAEQDAIVSSLKEKIKNLEEQNKSVKCLICLEPYTKPVVSTTCWHVHCEECWLMTMGVKKLCPQCNLIVFPSDLRRIYL